MIGEFVTVLHDGTDTAAIPQGLFRQTQLPVTVIQTREGVRGLIPVVEVAHEIERVSGRSPLAVDPAFEGMMKAVIFMRIGKVREAAVFHQRIAHAMIVVHAEFDIPFERNQSPVLLKNAKHEKVPFRFFVVVRNGNAFRVETNQVNGKDDTGYMYPGRTFSYNACLRRDGSSICDRAMARNINAAPLSSRGLMRSWRISQPDRALKTLSRLMTRLATVALTPT